MRIVACLVLLAFTACTSTYRVGAPVALPADPPQGECEQRGWVQLVPTTVSTQASDNYRSGNWLITETHSETTTGLGAYRGRGGLIDVARVEELTHQPDLYGYSQERIDSIGNHRTAANALAWGGGTLAIGGAVVIGASGGEAAGGGLAAALVGLVGMVVGLIVKPNALDDNYYAVRSRVFLDGEADLERLGSAVDATNLQTRDRCH